MTFMISLFSIAWFHRTPYKVQLKFCNVTIILIPEIRQKIAWGFHLVPRSSTRLIPHIDHRQSTVRTLIIFTYASMSFFRAMNLA